MRSIISWGMILLAAAAWGGFAFLVVTLHADRVAYADAAATYEAESLRGESATRLRATVRDTEVERAALESVVGITLLDAAEIIEEAGRKAGATDVSIGEATPLATTPQKLTSYTFVVNAQGSFIALARAVSVFESLPMPATIERFEISKGEKTWRLTARLRATLAAQK